MTELYETEQEEKDKKKQFQIWDTIASIPITAKIIAFFAIGLILFMKPPNSAIWIILILAGVFFMGHTRQSEQGKRVSTKEAYTLVREHINFLRTIKVIKPQVDWWPDEHCAPDTFEGDLRNFYIGIKIVDQSEKVPKSKVARINVYTRDVTIAKNLGEFTGRETVDRVRVFPKNMEILDKYGYKDAKNNN